MLPSPTPSLLRVNAAAVTCDYLAVIINKKGARALQRNGELKYTTSRITAGLRRHRPPGSVEVVYRFPDKPDSAFNRLVGKWGRWGGGGSGRASRDNNGCSSVTLQDRKRSARANILGSPRESAILFASPRSCFWFFFFPLQTASFCRGIIGKAASRPIDFRKKTFIYPA